MESRSEMGYTPRMATATLSIERLCLVITPFLSAVQATDDAD